MRADVVVVGGGLSGLAVAAQLLEAGLEPLLVEASGRLGGRAHEERIDGFRVGGGHLAHTAWPALGSLAEPVPSRPARLDLRALSPGVRIHADGAALRFGAAPSRPPGFSKSRASRRSSIGSPSRRRSAASPTSPSSSSRSGSISARTSGFSSPFGSCRPP